MQKEEARKRISELVAHFDEQIDTLKQGDYNETQTRIDFINPFFKALGWDIDNEKGNAEAYREVIHEDKTKVKEGKNEKTKAPDYAFRLEGGKRLFFVEAKKPSVAIKDDIVPAYQLRRYGWSAKLPISIITDFEEFAVYDCTKKPKPNDKASTARIKYITYKDYDKEFDFLWDTFSKAKVLTGSFDHFIQSDKQKKGTETVDKEFLVSLDEWRKYLATNIAWNNKNLNEDEINYAVQMTIDRIIFLRIAEDRFVEKYGRLKECLSKGIFYRNLFDYFKEADKKYNSGLFDFSKDKITEKLIVENKAVKSILNDLYYPESPFEFSEIPVEILGSAYEQFLGKVIRLTPGHIAKIDEKPEVRKAGGVYYTPQYIVEYIVQNTVGKLIAGKSPDEISKIKIVDPACGSGSFLIGAYQYLLTYHKDYYSKNGKPSKGKKDSPLTPEGNLTTAEKKRILTNNIYGVDIDVNAVEVTKLSLLLKCMEGETEASIATQMKLFHDRVLPTLDNNIKDGNSLIDTDYYDGQIDFGDEKKIKPFNWQRAFPEVFKIRHPNPQEELKWHNKTVLKQAEEAEEKAKALIEKHGWMVKEDEVHYGETGGFDVVIGNPPYVFGRDWKSLGIGDDVKSYLGNHYKSSPYQLDFFSIFMERGTQLINNNGIVSFIVPNVWLTNTYSSTTRRFILRNASELKVSVPETRVFENLTVDTIIYFYKIGSKKDKKFTVAKIGVNKEILISELDFQKYETGEKPISTSLSQKGDFLIEKIKLNGIELGKMADITRGVHPYRLGGYGKSAFGKGTQTKRDVEERPYNSKIYKSGYYPFIYGKDLKRFSNVKANEFIYYGDWLAEPRDRKFFEGERIYSRKILGEKLIVTIDKANTVSDQQVYITKLKNEKISVNYIAAILGSNLIGFYIRNYFDEINDAFPQIKISQLKSLPIKLIDIKNKLEKLLYDEIVKNVDLLLKLNQEKQETKLQTKIEQLQTRIDYVEEQINKAVYKLYDLTEDEIKIVEQK